MVGQQHDATEPRDELPPRRIVLLGASNLTRGIAVVVDTARQIWGRPLDVLAALGHGRSYGMRSTVLGRSLPSTLDCGLWDALAARTPAPTAALVTDIGNDVMYEAPVDRIVDWVGECLDRLLAIGAKVAVSRLPVANIAKLSELKFRVLRRLMFPMGRSDLATIAARAIELDQRIAELAGARGVALVEQQTEWYGFDPIHLRRRHWRCAWAQMLAPWMGSERPLAPADVSLLDELYLRTRVPQERWWLGLPQRRTQPCGALRDGTVISFY